MKKTPNVKLFNAAIRHQVYLHRYAGGQAKLLKQDIIAIRKMVQQELRGITKIRSRNDRIAFLKKLDDMIAGKFEVSAEGIQKALESIGNYEAAFYQRLLSTAINLPMLGVGKRVISDLVYEKAFTFNYTETMSIGDALAQFGDAKTKQILNTVKDGITNGSELPAISDSIAEITGLRMLNQADTLARTLVQQVTTASRNELYDENSDVLEAVEWSATLDNATCDDCAELDGQTWPVGEESEDPGFHWNCRCVLIPVVKDEFNAAAGAQTFRAARDEQGNTILIDKATGERIED